MANTECYEEKKSRGDTGSMSLAERVGSQLIGRIAGWPYFDVPVACYAPPLDVRESDASFKVFVEIPGVDQSSVSITVADGNLVIQGDKKSQMIGDEELCSCSERCFGEFKRVLKLPTTVSPDGIQAHLSQGILEVTLPKREEVKPHPIKIQTD